MQILNIEHILLSSLSSLAVQIKILGGRFSERFVK